MHVMCVTLVAEISILMILNYQLQVSYNDISLCKECRLFAKKIEKFKNRAEELESMFDEIIQLDQDRRNLASVNSIRDEYGLGRLVESDVMKSMEGIDSSDEDIDNTRIVDLDNRDAMVISSIDKIIEDEIRTNIDISRENLRLTSDYDEKFFK